MAMTAMMATRALIRLRPAGVELGVLSRARPWRDARLPPSSCRAYSSSSSSPPPPPPNFNKKRHPRQTILAVACAASVMIGVFSEVLWYKFSPHAAAAGSASTPAGTSKSGTTGSGRSVHAEPANQLSSSSLPAANRNQVEDDGEEDCGGNALLAARLAHLTHLSSLSLYDAYLSDHAKGAALSIPDAVRALVRALPDDISAPSLGEATDPGAADALPPSMAPITSLLAAAALASGDSPDTLSPADMRIVGALVATPVDAYTTAFRVLDADGSGTLSMQELKRAVTSACDSHSGWVTTTLADDDSDDGDDQAWIQPLLCHLTASAFTNKRHDHISLTDFSAFLTALRTSLSSAIYATHASASNGTLMTAHDFAWVLLAMSTSPGDDALDARARLVQVAKDSQLAQAVVTAGEWAAFDELVHRTGEFLEAIRVVSSVTELQVRGDRTIDADLFSRAARAIGVYLSPAQIEVMCRVLDTNGDGRLSVLEFLHLSDSLASFGLRNSSPVAPTKWAASHANMDPSAPLAQILRSSTGSSVVDVIRELPERTARWWSCVQAAPGPWTVGVKEGTGGCKHH